MPPIRKYQKEDIVDAAYHLVKEEGFRSVNARRIAQELGCSVQPIFHNFSTMEELHLEVYQRICNKYQEYIMKEAVGKQAYKKIGLSYIKFAREYPEFYKILFMQQTGLTADTYMMDNSTSESIIQAGQKLTGFSYEEQKKFHLKVMIFTHGIACFVATRTVEFSDDEIDSLLETTVGELFRGYKEK